MPTVSRSRVVAVPIDGVWSLISDPHSLPRWWPRVTRVEDVRGEGKRIRWTTVLGTERGSGVRADYRCTALDRQSRFSWEQDVAGTPFERILRTSAIDIQLAEAGPGTSVRVTSAERLRGLSRLGSGMMRTATRRRLDDALEGIERALVG